MASGRLPGNARGTFGVICYASVGGNDVVATELAKALAWPRPQRAPHQHRYTVPAGGPAWACRFTRSRRRAYPLLREPQYLLSLANKVVQVARASRLDIIHAHYAIPHATAALLSQQVLGGQRSRGPVPRVVTTMHGTDITVVGNDPSYSEIVAF